MKHLEFHGISKLFPLMPDAELKQLAQDIQAHGLQEPIWLHEGKILDGRNRWRACILAGVEPLTRNYAGTDPATFVLSLNVHRRHLTPSQKAAVAVEALPWFEQEAKKRRGARTDIVPNLERSDFGRAVIKAAAAIGVGKQYVCEAKTLQQQSPALYEQVKNGQITLQQAKLELRRAEHARKLEVRAARPKTPSPQGPFDLILADPPWLYEFSASSSRHIENQYQTASLVEICSHRPNAKPNSVLFLWATGPKLAEALRVMADWSFQFVSSAVWDKVTPGMGYWFRGQHELLLVGVQGKFPPPIQSERVASIFHSPRQGHSTKPECVYTWIERAFPEAEKLEMYCRTPRPGWAVWGHEVA